MSLVQSLPNHDELHQPNNSQFTCISCQVVFPSSELQRTHYRTDWHKYNLKRKIADLSPVTPHQFNEKVLAQQAKGQEEVERAATVYYCGVCRKSYGTEPAYESHLRSKKHRDSEIQQENPTHQITAADTTTGAADENDLTLASSLRCLFCNKTHTHFDDNLHHMSKFHGFFLPDVEYLADAEGLVQYLSNKIRSDLSCLYCKKALKSIQATMTHMVDKGHCKMAYDDSEDVDALLRYYDFGTMVDEDGDSQIPTTEKNQDGELVLQNGARLGNRHLLKHYKQKQQRSTHEDQDGDQSHSGDRDITDDGTSSTTAVMDQQEQRPESLLKNRYERRHPHLAITSGQFEEHRNKTSTGIHEAAKKNAYHYQVGIKHNANNTQRLRLQNPV